MALSLNSVLVPAFRQSLPQVKRMIDKAEAHCAAQGLDPAALIEARLVPDMLPFGYQVKSSVVHSLGAIEGVRRGSFSPDTSAWPDSFDGLRTRTDEALATIAALDAAEIDGFVGRDMRFVAGERRMDFTAEDFLLSFSLPNFYFHVTTAYDILRANGLPLGKADFIGRPRLKG